MTLPATASANPLRRAHDIDAQTLGRRRGMATGVAGSPGAAFAL